MNAFSATDDEPSGFLIMAWMRYSILCFLVSLCSLSAATHVSTLNELKLEGARDSLLRLRTTDPLANHRPGTETSNLRSRPFTPFLNSTRALSWS